VTPLNQLSEWAALKLLRLAPQGSERRLRVAAALVQEAARFANPSKEDRAEFYRLRARALRAAHFFGGTLSQDDDRWLANVPDTGVDPLVLRPGHLYPPPQVNMPEDEAEAE